MTTTAVQADPTVRFGYNHMILAGWGVADGAITPFTGGAGEASEKIGERQVDHVAGAGLEVEGATVRAGYLGSQGMYANFTQDAIKAFATAAITDEFQRLGHAALGLDRVPIDDMLGSLHARRLDLVPPSVYERASASTNSQKQLEAVEFITGHWEALNIADPIDTLIGVAAVPDPLLHDARVRYHTAKTDPERFEYQNGGFSLSAGIAQMPNMWYYGVEGGVRFQFEIAGQTEAFDSIPMTFSIRMNDPDTLAVFPYAQNAVALYDRLGIPPERPDSYTD